MPPHEFSPTDEKFGLALTRYLVQLSERIKELEIFSQSKLNGILLDQDRAMLIALFHRLAGSGGIYGFPSLSENARTLEGFLDSSQPVENSLLSEKIAQFCLECKKVVGKRQEDSFLSHFVDQSAPPLTPLQSLPLILTIDDDPMIRQAIRALLGKEARLIQGENTVDAEQLMREHSPSLVLLDDIMPGGITGLKFLETIKNDPILSKIPVIMLTASDKNADVLRGLAAGACDYITKPFNPEKLRQTVRDVLSRKPHRVILKLNDSRLIQNLSDRLSQLNCLVHTLKNGDGDIWDHIGSEFTIVIGDQDSLAIDDFLLRSTEFPNCRLLYLVNGDEVISLAAQAATVTLLARTDKEDDIVRRIGQILVSQRTNRTKDAP